jgi:hypothetical protein
VEASSKPVGLEIPKPQHLSKKPTPLTDDPLYLEAFVVECHRGFTEDAEINTFTITADSFVTLVTRTYHTVCAADKEFARYVSLSMYLYYNTLHFWARTAAIREHRGFATEEERNLIRYLRSEEYPVHETVNAYLRGIGNFEDPSGTKHQFRLMRLSGTQDYEALSGFFGRVDANTHYLYEGLPAPGILAARLLRDLGYTRHVFDNPDWTCRMLCVLQKKNQSHNPNRDRKRTRLQIMPMTMRKRLIKL